MAKQKKQKDLPDFSFPVFGNWELLESNLKNRLPLELFLKHEGYKIVVGKETYVLRILDSEMHPKDALRLKIQTFRRIAIDAKHYYGHLLLPSIQFKKENEPLDSHGGWGFPLILRKIDLERQMTPLEREAYERRFGAIEEIEDTFVRGFNTQKYMHEHAQEVAAKYFPGFRLVA